MEKPNELYDYQSIVRERDSIASQLQDELYKNEMLGKQKSELMERIKSMKGDSHEIDILATPSKSR